MNYKNPACISQTPSNSQCWNPQPSWEPEKNSPISACFKSKTSEFFKWLEDNLGSQQNSPLFGSPCFEKNFEFFKWSKKNLGRRTIEKMLNEENSIVEVPIKDCKKREKNKEKERDAEEEYDGEQGKEGEWIMTKRWRQRNEGEHSEMVLRLTLSKLQLVPTAAFNS